MIKTNNIIYKDDFIDSGVEDKNYLRILFNGGRSVQIRELNQLQSILQSQIDKFGSSLYKSGAAVIGGVCTFDRKVHTITFSNDVLVNVTVSEIDTLLQGVNLSADVLDYATDELFTTFYIRYSSGDGGDNSGGEFDIGSAIGLEARETGGNSDIVTAASADIVAGAFLSEGVFFVNGSFVVTPKQNVFMEIPDIDGITGSIVLEVEENFVTYIQDSTLLDNATGQPNYLAPGADRYQITLTLAYRAADAEADEINRITLLDITNSNVVINTKAKYSDLDRQLAQRTYEESGNYALNPFNINIADLAGSSRPGSEDVDATERVYVGLDPSIAYVDGYRIELDKKYDMSMPRARTTVEKEVNISLNFGNFIDVSLNTGSAIPLPNTVNLTYDLVNSAPTTIGSCRIKSVESVGAFFRLFLYDIVLSGSYNIADIATIEGNGLDVTAESTVQETASDSGVFKLPYDNVKSLAAINPSDLTYVIKKIYTGSANSSGEFTINTGANEVFGDSSVGNFIVEADGEWLPVSGVGAFTILSANTSSITLGSLGNGVAVKVIFPVTVSSNTPATKTLVEVVSEIVVPTGNKYTLATSDIFDISEVLIDGTAIDITDDIVIFSDGQRASMYTNSELQYVGAGTPPDIEVTYRHFTHNGLPFSANSYPINFDENDVLAVDEIRFKDVPSWNGFKLSDCLDFRPTILAAAGTTTAIQVDPNSALSSKPTFFVPRLDKVIVNSNGEFKIINGIPKLNPTFPDTPPSAMALYELSVPAFTFNASDIVIKLIDNRRYTMRDIGKIDKRLDSLEYYTSLSLLEKSVTDRSIFDEVQGSRFKNGIVVDPFNGHGVGNVFSEGYACAIDSDEGTLRPKFVTDSVDLVYQSGSSSGVRLNENTITLDFTEEPIISQLVSSESESVNPYDVAAFIGNVKLFPTNDQWFETNRRPNVIINNNGAYDALKFAIKESGVLGTEWNSWKTNWSGVLSKESTALHSTRAPDGVLRAREISVVAKVQSRRGTKTTLKNKTTTKNLGDRVIDISFVPFIRSRKVYFQATGLKPNTQVYAFFDGINISEYAAETVSVIKTSELSSIKEYFDKEPGDSGFITQTDLISDADGELIGAFIIPNNDLLKFPTGEREFRLSDSPTNNTEEETCFAEGTYTAAGTVKTVEATIISTRVPVVKTHRVRDVRSTVDTKVRYYDPLAQTFIINDIQEGVFVTSLDLYFTAKSKTGLPVTARLVAVDNGYPTQRVIPFSDVTLKASDVNIDGSATNFAFSDPVYLQSGVEYAMVILSNDPAYRIRVSRLGGTDENGKIIQSNPYGGVMFMSQNASTWTADQTRDIKFVLNRAVFDTGVTGLAQFKSIMREGVQSITITDPGSLYNGATIDISAPDTGTDQAFATPIVDLVSGTIIGATVTNPGSGYTTAPTITINNGGTGSGATATAKLYQAKTSTYNLIQNTIVNEGTGILNTITVGATSYTNVDANQNYTPTAEFTVSKTNRVTLDTDLVTDSEYITPVIDLDTMALLCIENLVNNSLTNEDTSDFGGALSRYITREVELNDPADQLNMYLDVNRPTENAKVTAYVKVKYDSNTYSDWILVNPQASSAITDDPDAFTETQYVFTSTSNDFIAFALKLVFTATSTTAVATCKNLRIIATS